MSFLRPTSFFRPTAQPLFDPRMALFDAGLYNQNYAQKAAPGAMDPFAGGYQTMNPPVAAGYGVRRQLNWVAIFSAVVVPFGIFLGTFCIMSFYIYYRYPMTALLVIACIFLSTLIMGAFWTQAKRKEIVGGQQTWHYFIFMTSLAAAALGSGIGYLNMDWYANRYYDYISLRKAVDVSPGQWKGGQILDAGEIQFEAGSRIDSNMRSMWHKSSTFCAAPVVPADGAKLGSYDFWAVGMECCAATDAGPNVAAFTCGEEGAVSGLRVIEADEIEGYQLAVRQAAAKHGIEAKRPIFLYMLADPYKKIRSYMDNAMGVLFTAAACHLVMQTVLVGMQTYQFGLYQPSGYLKDAIGGHHKQMGVLNYGVWFH